MTRRGSIVTHLITILLFLYACGEEKSCSTGDSECVSNLNDEDFFCADKHERCELWTEHGECLINPVYMRTACPLSCLICTDKLHFDNEESL